MLPMNRSLGMLLLSISFSLPIYGQLKTKNIILITTDGLRWQEVMTGADPGLLNKENGGVQNIPATKQAYLRDTPQARRQALMPFFWNVIAKHGQVYGNQTKASIARITNTMKFSYPGYNEILCGFADPKIDSNDRIPNKNVTVLEWLNRNPAFAGKVAAFSGWNVMTAIINRDRCGFTVFAGPEPLPEINSPTDQLLNDLILETSRTYDNEIADSFVFHAAYANLLSHKPRVFYVGFGETDTFGHSGRYDKILDSAHRVDAYVKKLWESIQSMDEYRDRTTLIFTTDHGRGFAPSEWKSHGKDIKGAENIWMAFMGPDTPALGERSNIDVVTQNQIAATLAALLGEDYHATVPQSGSPIRDVFPKSK
jgi:hypothetical protein